MSPPHFWNFLTPKAFSGDMPQATLDLLGQSGEEQCLAHKHAQWQAGHFLFGEPSLGLRREDFSQVLVHEIPSEWKQLFVKVTHMGEATMVY